VQNTGSVKDSKWTPALLPTQQSIYGTSICHLPVPAQGPFGLLGMNLFDGGCHAFSTIA